MQMQDTATEATWKGRATGREAKRQGDTHTHMKGIQDKKNCKSERKTRIATYLKQEKAEETKERQTA